MTNFKVRDFATFGGSGSVAKSRLRLAMSLSALMALAGCAGFGGPSAESKAHPHKHHAHCKDAMKAHTNAGEATQHQHRCGADAPSGGEHADHK